MSEPSSGLVGSDQKNRIGPDLFSFYRHEVVDLLSQNDDLLVFSSKQTEVHDGSAKVLEKCGGTNCSSNVIPLFSNSMEGVLPDMKRELLNGLLRDSLRTCSQEVDEMLDPVIRVRRILSYLQRKKMNSGAEDMPLGDAIDRPCKKLKRSVSSSSASVPLHDSPDHLGSGGEVNEDFQLLVEIEDNEQLEKAMNKHSNELSQTLNHMMVQLEELLVAAVSKCRQMSLQEKHQLWKLIQKLPPKNLQRVLEIVYSENPSEAVCSDEFFVDLEKLGNITLWRLYFFVKAVENARKLSATPKQ